MKYSSQFSYNGEYRTQLYLVYAMLCLPLNPSSYIHMTFLK